VLPTSGHTTENIVVHVEAAGIVLAGAMACFGVTPLAFQGDPGVWADSLDAIASLGSVIVPGHGPVGGVAALRDQQAYLRGCVSADGDPARIPAGPWDAWAGREFDAVNVERAAMLARGDPGLPPTMRRVLGME
jgi:cyclase